LEAVCRPGRKCGRSVRCNAPFDFACPSEFVFTIGCNEPGKVVASGYVEQTSTSGKRTINSFSARFAKDRFIKRRCRGSNIAFCSARIAAEASNVLFDGGLFHAGVRAGLVVEK
jgi:hypothetical protein